MTHTNPNEDFNSSPGNNTPHPTELLKPIDAINAMLDLRIQMAELQQQIIALQPTFQAACVSLHTDRITLERAIITRRLTPGQWAYSGNILEQQEALKLLKKHFQQTHEPISGREVTWTIKLLSATATDQSATSLNL